MTQDEVLKEIDRFQNWVDSLILNYELLDSSRVYHRPIEAIFRRRGTREVHIGSVSVEEQERIANKGLQIVDEMAILYYLVRIRAVYADRQWALHNLTPYPQIRDFFLG